MLKSICFGSGIKVRLRFRAFNMPYFSIQMHGIAIALFYKEIIDLINILMTTFIYCHRLRSELG